MVDKLIYKIFEGLFLSGKESFFKYLMFFRQKSRYIFSSVLRYLSIEGRRSKVEGRSSKVEAQSKSNFSFAGIIHVVSRWFTEIHTTAISTIFESHWGCEAQVRRFWGFEVLRSWGLEVLRSWVLEVLRSWGLEVLRSWGPEVRSWKKNVDSILSILGASHRAA